MKFQRVLKEIDNSQNNKKRLDEALLTDIIDNWPVLVVYEYKVLNAETPQDKQKFQQRIDAMIGTITTFGEQRWTGNFEKDLVQAILNKNYILQSYTIKDKAIQVIYGNHNEMVSYINSPAAKALFSAIGKIYNQQIQNNQNNQPIATNPAIAQKPAGITLPSPQQARSSAINKLSNI